MPIFRRIYSLLFDALETLVIGGAIFVIFYAFLFRPFQVNGQSMYPNFKNGEYVLTNIIGLHFSQIDRGDVIVFKSPKDSEKDFIKRVIGTPGDRIKLLDGQIFVNGMPLYESYVSEDLKTYGGPFVGEEEEIVVPEGSFFVLGDNRLASSDSREWGYVKEDGIIGKSFLVYWPPQDFRIIGRALKQ